MRTRVRAPEGTFTVTLPDNATVGDLISQITEKTSIQNFDTKYGYPPKPLLLSDSEQSSPLSTLGVELNGEQLIVSRRDDLPAPQTSTKAASTKSGISPATTTPSNSKPEPVSLKRKGMDGDVPEQPFPERGTTIGNLPML